MAKPKNTGLGRGLDAIFLDNSVDQTDNVLTLRISEIEPNPNQPRKEFDAEALSQLADSIATHGLIQPIIVRYTENEGYYEIVAGERRWRAAKMAGLTQVPVIIMDLDNKKAAQISLIENIQREDLNAIEEAMAYNSLIDEHNMTQEDISRQIGKSRSAIANTLRLLELPEDVIGLVEKGSLSAGHARALLGLKNQDQINSAATAVVNKGMSVRATEQLVRNMNKLADQAAGSKTEAKPQDKPLVNYISELSARMTSRLGHKVSIHNDGKVKKIEIQYANNDDLEQIIKLLCGDNIFDD